MKRVLFGVFFLLISLSSALAADPSERRFIEKGMSEGEVLARIGKPDSESFDSGGGATETIKSWIYLPALGDEQTTTTVVLKNGKVISVTRDITRHPTKASERRFVSKGMSQGEVLAKIGPADSESLDSGNEATETVKRWIYLPAPGDEQTITTIVLKNGKVIQVIRELTR